MTGSWDADIKLVYALDRSRSVAIDTIKNSDAFDVIANIRIGQSLMQIVSKCDLFVSVRNLSQSSALLSQKQSYALAPQSAPLNQQLIATFDAGWNADEGDVLEVIATFKVTAGVHQNYSLARSTPFIVSG